VNAPRPIPRLSLALRISIASALFGLAIAGGGVLLGYWALGQQLESRALAELRGKQGLLEHLVSEAPSASEAGGDGHRFRDLLIGHDDLHLALLDAKAGVVTPFSAVGAQSVPILASADGIPRPWRASSGARLTGVRATARAADGTPVDYVLSIDRRHDAGLLAGFLRATTIGLPAVLLLVAVGAWLIARTSLAPLRRFRRVASSVGASSLGQRLSLDGLPAELAELGREFNLMLERIDAGYSRLQAFSGDLAHEMRTPVATLLGRTQVMLTKQRSAAELREALESNVEEFERLSRLIADMLFIARADAGETPIHKETFDLAQEAQHVADYLGLMAEDKGVSVQVAGDPAAVSADRLLVQRAITNLLTNAIRHSPTGARIRIETGAGRSVSWLEVCNEGEAIPAEHLPHLFDRFYRADAGRARDSGGSGLGLAIVKSIMETHGGAVSAASSAEGATRFRLEFPA
jgi:two-component system heavy metal sensor histidine kinase CusS